MNSVFIVLSKLFSSGIGFFSTIVAGYFFDVSSYGLYSLFITAATFFSFCFFDAWFQFYVSRVGVGFHIPFFFSKEKFFFFFMVSFLASLAFGNFWVSAFFYGLFIGVTNLIVDSFSINGVESRKAFFTQVFRGLTILGGIFVSGYFSKGENWIYISSGVGLIVFLVCSKISSFNNVSLSLEQREGLFWFFLMNFLSYFFSSIDRFFFLLESNYQDFGDVLYNQDLVFKMFTPFSSALFLIIMPRLKEWSDNVKMLSFVFAFVSFVFLILFFVFAYGLDFFVSIYYADYYIDFYLTLFLVASASLNSLKLVFFDSIIKILYGPQFLIFVLIVSLVLKIPFSYFLIGRFGSEGVIYSLFSSSFFALFLSVLGVFFLRCLYHEK